MRPIKVEFVSKQPVPRWVWFFALLAGGIFVLIEGLYALQTWKAYKSVQSKEQLILSQREKLQRDNQLATAPLQSAPGYLKDAEGMAKLAGFPLNNVLTAIETVNLPEVKVVGIEITAADASVRLELEVSSNDAILKAINQLNQGEPSPRWYLVSGSPSNSSNGAGRASFISSW